MAIGTMRSDLSPSVGRKRLREVHSGISSTEGEKSCKPVQPTCNYCQFSQFQSDPFDYPGALALDYDWSNSSDKSASTGKFELTQVLEISALKLRFKSQNYLIRLSRLPSSFLTRTKGSLLETTTIGFVTYNKDDLVHQFILTK